MRIDHYCILAKSNVTGKYYFVDGYKTLQTLKKKYYNLLYRFSGFNHDPICLVSRSYEKKIIRVYLYEEGCDPTIDLKEQK